MADPGPWEGWLRDWLPQPTLRASGNRRVAYVSRNDGKAVESF
jgi:hypothetical protein